MSEVAHPGVELVHGFVAHGEFGVGDVVEAWRACAVAVAAFQGISARRLLEIELQFGAGLDAEVPAETREFVRAGLVDDLDLRAGPLEGWDGVTL